MKQIGLLMISLMTLSSMAQQIPNGDMETWTISGSFSPDGEYPTDWSTVNNTIPDVQAWLLSQTCLQEVTDVHGGSFAAHLITVAPPVSGFPNVNGIVTNGDINETTYAVENGIAFTARPDSLVGYFKAIPVGTDFATIEFVLKDGNEDTLGWARFEAPNTIVANYTRFSVPVVYSSAATPTTAVVLLSSSDGFNSIIGSELWVDDLELIYNPIGIEEEKLDNSTAWYNGNSIVLDLTKSNSRNVQVSVIDLAGKEVYSSKTSGSQKHFIPANVSNGLYFVRVSNSTYSHTHKVIVSKN